MSSERVKSVDIHPTEPWTLGALYSGKVLIWDYESGSVAKSFELSDLPVRCAKFIPRKQWIVAASDDMKLRVYNYNTQEKIKEFEAHSDYIRTVEIHPTLPYILSSSDDMSVKLWDWDKNFANSMTYEGHAHYVMMVKFNPKDTNTFATASLDRTIKVWGLNSNAHHYSLEGHERGVNCVDYYPSGDKPYLLSGADDKTVKVRQWQQQSNSKATAKQQQSNSKATAKLTNLNLSQSSPLTPPFHSIPFHPFHSGVGLPNKKHRPVPRRPHPQRLRGNVPPQAPHNLLRLRGRNNPNLAVRNVQSRNDPQLRDGTSLGSLRDQGGQ